MTWMDPDIAWAVNADCGPIPGETDYEDVAFDLLPVPADTTTTTTAPEDDDEVGAPVPVPAVPVVDEPPYTG